MQRACWKFTFWKVRFLPSELPWIWSVPNQIFFNIIVVRGCLLAAGDCLTRSDPVSSPFQLGEKKGQKSGRNKKANKSKSNQRKNNKKSSVPHTGNDLSAKIYSTMEKHKEVGVALPAC